MIRRRFLTWLSNRLRARCIYIGTEPYLFRYYLGSVFGVTFYMHEFVRADAERWLHDHPWRLSLGVVLVGGYIEERMTGLDPNTGPMVRTRRIRWLNIITGSTAHRITEPRPGTWTLFCHTPRVKGWGFYEYGRAVDWFAANDNEPLPIEPRAAGMGVIYHQPFPVESSKGWHRTAPRGWVLKREVYGHTAKAA